MNYSWAKLFNAGMIIIVLLLLASCANNTILDPTKPPANIVLESPATPEDNPRIIEHETMEPQKPDIGELSEQPSEPYFIATEYKLFPPLEQNYDAEFEKVFIEFADAVYSKDLLAIDGFLDGEILNSFGDGGWGKHNFYDIWDLNQNPEQSALWVELGKIIQLGGVYTAEDRDFVAPYIFSNFPDEFDVFEY